MKLDSYLRSVVQQNMFKYINMCKCEKCGVNDNLEIHHKDNFFFEIVDKTISDLNLPYYLEHNEYTKEQIDMISTYLLGLHLKSKYSILCSKCHDQIHKENVKRRHRKIDEIDKNAVLNYLSEIEGKYIYSSDRNILAELLKTRYVGINSLNNILDILFQTEYTYRLFSKDEKGYRYIDKRRKLENGTINPNRDKTYWILRR